MQEDNSELPVADIIDASPSSPSLDDQEAFRETQEALHVRKQSRFGPAFWFMVSFLAFILFAGEGGMGISSVKILGLILLILFIHESGHGLGMKLFNYSNIRMFFIPLFGAAVSGRKHGVPHWQEGIVVFLGPLPGLIGGCVVILAWPGEAGDAQYQVAGLFILINAFNLLPLLPLDGGRLFNLMLFSRHPALELGFRLLTSVGLGVLAYQLDSWILGIFGAIGFLTAGVEYGIARAAREMRNRWPDIPGRLNDLTEEQSWWLFYKIKEIFGPKVKPKAQARANTIVNLHDRALSRPMSFGVAFLFFGVYVATCALLYRTIPQTHPFNQRATIQAYTHAILSAPNDPEPLLKRGEYFVRIEVWEGAILDFSSAIDLDPDNARAYAARSGVYAELKDFKSAERDLKRACRLDPEHVEYAQKLSELYEDFGRFPTATHDLAPLGPFRGEFGPYPPGD